jgi:N-acetyl-anhydromuramoyl-L-alanine amidase
MRQHTYPSAALSLWQAGWLRNARRLDSPNFGSRPEHVVVDLIVVHSISLPPGQYGGQEVQDLFTNQLDWDAHPYFDQIRGTQVSSHFYIRRDGQLWQFVSCEHRAWHAGRSNFQGRDNCNDFAIGIELEGLEGQSFEPVQYRSLVDLCISLKQCYPITHVAGHEHIAPGRKFDPGAGFDWRLFQKNIAWPLECFPALFTDGSNEV